MFLYGKQQRQHDNSEWHHPRIKLWRDNLQPLYGRHYRNRRRNHDFSIEEAAANQANDDQHGGHSCRRIAPGKGHQGQNTALARVISPHYEREILKGDHQDQQPEDEREETKYGVTLYTKTKLTGQTFTKRIKRAGADITVDNPDRRKRYCG